jgi:hypothetical protein
MPQQPHPRKTARPNQTCVEQRLASCAWVFVLMSSAAAAQTVYRCGDQYSANPSCNGAAIPSISDARNARQAQTQTMQTVQAQQQADALEKNRLKAEQQTQRNAAVMPTYNRDAMFSSTVDSATAMPPSHGKHRKVASPYFTAKDNTPKSPQKKAEKNGASPKAAP